MKCPLTRSEARLILPSLKRTLDDPLHVLTNPSYDSHGTLAAYNKLKAWVNRPPGRKTRKESK